MASYEISILSSANVACKLRKRAEKGRVLASKAMSKVYRTLKHEFSRKPSYFVSHTNPKFSIYLFKLRYHPSPEQVKISIGGAHVSAQLREKGK